VKIDEEYFYELLKSRPFNETYPHYKELLNMRDAFKKKVVIKEGVCNKCENILVDLQLFTSTVKGCSICG